MAKHLSTTDEYVDFVFNIDPGDGATHVVWRVDELDQLAHDIHVAVLHAVLHGSTAVDAIVLERLRGTPADPAVAVPAAE